MSDNKSSVIQSEFGKDFLDRKCKRRWAEKLSVDKPCEFYRHGYIIYANDTRWFLENWVEWILRWIPYSDGNDLDKLISREGLSIDYKATWLPAKIHYRIIKRIIYTHPNLERKGWWKLKHWFNFYILNKLPYA